MSIDEALRSLLRDAEHAHDATLWLRAASAAARAREFDDAGRALLWARALGAETGPVDDLLAPATLEHERRGVGALLTSGPLSFLAWGPRSDTLYAVAEHRTIVALGVEPGANRKVKEVPGFVNGLGATLRDEALAVVYGVPQAHRVALLDIESKKLDALGDGRFHSPDIEVAAFLESDVWVRSKREASRFAAAAPGPLETVHAEESAFTWKGELARPAPPKEGAPRTLRMVFSEESLVLSFPTRRSVERFAEQATIGAVGLSPHEIRSSVKCVAVSPSGRHAAFARAGSVVLADLETEETRTVELDGVPSDARWSPSGRRLAVLTPLRVHVLTFTG